MLRSLLLKCSCCCYSFPHLNFVLNLCWKTCFSVFSSKWAELVQETDHPDHKYQHPSVDNQWPGQPTANRPWARSDGGSCLQPRSSSGRLLPHYAEGFRQRCECVSVGVHFPWYLQIWHVDSCKYPLVPSGIFKVGFTQEHISSVGEISDSPAAAIFHRFEEWSNWVMVLVRIVYCHLTTR